jgi:hypothetical protein
MDYSGYCLVEVGAPETGKTSVAMKLLQKKVYKSILFVLSDNDDSIFHEYKSISPDEIKKGFRGVRKIIMDDQDISIDELFKIIFSHFKGSELVNGEFIPVALLIDDAMSMLNPRNEWVMKYVRKRRQRICDIVVNCHGLSHFPVSLYANITNIYIFHTLDSLKNIDNRLSGESADLIEKCVEYVNMVCQHGVRNKTRHKYFHLNFNTKMPPLTEDILLAMASNWWTRGLPKPEHTGTLKNA